MRIIQVVLILLATAVFAFAVGVINGDWEGVLKVNGKDLHLVLHVVNTGKGLKATFKSLDQKEIGRMGMPVEPIAFKGRQLEFQLKTVQATYTGTLQADGKTIAGSLSQLGQSFPLNF